MKSHVATLKVIPKNYDTNYIPNINNENENDESMSYVDSSRGSSYDPLTNL